MTHDVFVSYAHRDDQPPEGARYGWVTTFVEGLKKRLGQQLGKDPDVWMDHLLLENSQVDATLREKIRSSRTIVVFMSPSYLNSGWCKREIGEFLTVNRAHKNKESVFIVEIDETARENWHERLQALTPLALYEKSLSGATSRLGDPNPPHDANNAYWKQMNELAHLVKSQLAHIKTTTDQAAQPSAAPNSVIQADTTHPKVPTVWIAQPTQDLRRDWDSLAGAIRQRGARVLPMGSNTYPYSTVDAFRHAVERDLADADLLIQLLGPEVGTLVGDSSANANYLQALLAKTRIETGGGRFLQWRPVDLKLDAIADAKHRELLQGTTACGISQFTRQTLEWLDALMRPAAQPLAGETGALSLCISAGPKDTAFAEDIAGIVTELGHTPFPIPAVPAPEQKVDEYNAHIRALVGEVDGVILAHGQESASWIQLRRVQITKALIQRRKTWGAFLDGPPPDKPTVPCHGPGLIYLDCRDGSIREPIQRFIGTLLEEGAYA